MDERATARRARARIAAYSPIHTADSVAVIFSRVHAEISLGVVEYALIDVTRVSRHLSIVKYHPTCVRARARARELSRRLDF